MLICVTGGFGLGSWISDKVFVMVIWVRNDGLADWRSGVGRFTQLLRMAVT